MLRFARFDWPLEGLDELIVRSESLRPDGGSAIAAADEVEVVGPFPSVTVEARRLVTRSPIFLSGLKDWRALIEAAERPALIVDIAIIDGKPAYASRGGDAARAMAAVLESALEFQEAEAVFDVFWLSVPDVYVTGLLLVGPEDYFIPSRFGAASRPEPIPMPFETLIQRVTEIVQTADARTALGGTSLVEAGFPGSRSGLAD